MTKVKILNIVLILFSLFQIFNLKVSRKYEVSDGQFHAEYNLSQKRITREEFQKEIVRISEIEKEIELFENLSYIILMISGVAFIISFKYNTQKSDLYDRRTTEKHTREGGNP